MKSIYNKILVLIILLILSLQTEAQKAFTISLIETTLNNLSNLKGVLKYPKEVRELYLNNQYQSFWIHANDRKSLLVLLDIIGHAEENGLKQEDYQPDLYKRYIKNEKFINNNTDSLVDEVKLSDAAIHFLHDIESGNLEDLVSYNGLNYSPACNNLAKVLRSYINSGRLPLMAQEMGPKGEEFITLRNKLNFMRIMVAQPNFKDSIITSKEISISNLPLISRFTQLGFNETELKNNIKKAALLFDTYDNGKLSSQLLNALNVPIKNRITAIERAINTMRWLNCIKKENHVIVVNIPSANLKLYERGKMILESNIIVGKKTTPTPTLSSKITDVVIYPYWHVPNRIATHELLPSIKRNPTYLEANNFQLLDKKGKVMDASSINWKDVSANNFPYEIRQSTGCDNSLGLVKLNFYNPFSVYLHDTPVKGLFNSHKRYFSHGCMRLQKAVELAHYILKGNTRVMDSLIAKGCLKMQAPITIPASEIIPVFVLYNTAWINGSFDVIFYDDIYGKYIH